MVRPTTERPWRTRSAATVELSTPPLMATAIGAVSGMHADSAQMGDRGLDGLDECIDLLDGVGAAEQSGEAIGFRVHAAAGKLGGRAKGRDSRDVLGAGTAIALVMSAEANRRQARAAAHVERAYALGRIEFVAAHRVEVHAESLH